VIRGSINLPAQSLYHTIPALYRLFKAANLAKVIWFCGEFTSLSCSRLKLNVNQDLPGEEVHELQAGLLIT
jgi:hypothetical protein